MGLMDKFKNLFTDEEIIEEDEIDDVVEIKEIKKEETKEHKLPTFMREKMQEETSVPKKDEVIEKVVEVESEVKINNSIMDSSNIEVEKNNFKFPVFDDSDFVETTRLSRQEIRNAKIASESSGEIKPIVKKSEKIVKKDNDEKEKNKTKVSELYSDKKVKKEPEKKFKATPIISPIYGVMDKNYVPDDVASNLGDNYEINRHSKNVDFDSVRKKAYGSLSDDIKENLMCENCEYLKEVKACKKKTKASNKDNLMYKTLCEEKEEDITLDEATENYYDYGVEYNKVKKYEPDYSYEENNFEEIKSVEEEVVSKKKSNDVPPVKSSINLLSTLKKSMGDDEIVNTTNDNDKDLELTDDLFSLIDSMYEERND